MTDQTTNPETTTDDSGHGDPPPKTVPAEQPASEPQPTAPAA